MCFKEEIKLTEIQELLLERIFLEECFDRTQENILNQKRKIAAIDCKKSEVKASIDHSQRGKRGRLDDDQTEVDASSKRGRRDDNGSSM